MTSFLMGVIERGTAKNINDFDFQVAGKTGTTNDNQDAWFVGYNSEITIGYLLVMTFLSLLEGLKLVQKLQLQSFMI